MPSRFERFERLESVYNTVTASPDALAVYVWPQSAIQWAKDALETLRAQAAEITSLKERVARLAARLHAWGDDSDPTSAQAAGSPGVNDG